MNKIPLNIQRFSDGKVVIDTELNSKKFEKGLDKMKSASQKAGSTIKNIVVGLGIAKLVSVAMNQITQSIDGAISRFDTLNNFPKVMSSLGIASEDAEASIKKMSDKLAGLPTTLDQGASAVQRFTSFNGDVKKSTDIFLAVNNAILAGGASAEAQASALEQLTQAYTKGKPEANDWKILMQAMPAQLKQVATTMGYTSTAIGGDFYEALQKGEISMDDFMDTVVKLNEEGGEGFASFAEQAKAGTQGIGTAITVAKTQIVKGVTDIIDALNIKLEQVGIGNLSDIIKKVGVDSKKALDIVAKLIKGEISVKEVVDLVSNLINNILTTINNNYPTIVQKGAELLRELLNGISSQLPNLISTAGQAINSFINVLVQELPSIIKAGTEVITNLIIGIAKQLPTLIPQMINVLLTIVEALIDNIDLIIDAGIELMFGLIDGLINTIPILLEKVPIIIDKLITKLTDPAMMDKIINAAATLTVKLGEGLIKALPKLIPVYAKIIQSILNGISSWFGHMVDIGKQVLAKIIAGISNKLGDLGQKAGEIASTIINKITSLPGKMLSWGKDMIQGLINGIKSKINAVGDAVKSVANKIKSFLHFSRPDEGPLREYEEWMPDMIKGLAETMKKSSHILSDESESLAQKIKDSMDLNGIYDDMQSAINLETNKVGASIEISGANRSIQNMLSASATFEGIIPLQVDLDGEKIYDNQQKISARKNLQYGGVR